MRRQAAAALDRQLSRCPAFWRAHNVAIYWPADGEIDMAPLVKRCRAMGKTLLLPVLAPAPARGLKFARYSSPGALIINRYGIPEPAQPPGQHLGVAQIDLLLMPLVAMDRQGNRIGMGAGYYDQTLKNITGRALCPALVGVGYQFQLVDKVEPQPWDVPLHWLATDQSLHRVKGVQPPG